MASQPLTAAEQAWVNENAEAVRALMAKTNKQDKQVPASQPPEDPVEAASDHLIRSMKQISNTIRGKIERNRERLDRNVRLASMPTDDQGSPDIARERQLLAEERQELEIEITKYEKHLGELKRKIELLTSDPQASFLPLGTVVRFVGVPKYENSLGLIDDRSSYPVADSIGVVTRLNRKGEFPISVSMRNEYKNGYGDVFYPDEGRLPTYFVDAEMLVVEEYGRLPDGKEYLGYGFHPTHLQKPEKSGKQGVEMVLEADGYFWRFHDFGGTQSIEALQAFDQMGEMSWVEGPLEQYAPRSGLQP